MHLVLVRLWSSLHELGLNIPKGEDPNKEKRRNTRIKLRLRLAIYGVIIVYVVTGNETAKDV